MNNLLKSEKAKALIKKKYRKYTERLIACNCSHVFIERTKVIENNGIAIEEVVETIGEEDVRFTDLNREQKTHQEKIGSSGVIESKRYNLIAKWDSLIKEGDVLKTENNEAFLVHSIKMLSMFSNEADFWFKLNGIVEKV